MAMRKGLGKGRGKGYRNIIGKDPRVHSDSGKGRKQPQRINIPLKTTRIIKKSQFEIKKGLDGRLYKISNETAYNINTPDFMVELLERYRRQGTRLRFHWGDMKTGKDWGEEHDVEGTMGRSTGTIKIPLLIYNKRSLGGGGILTHCIVKITTTTKPKRVIYQHTKYHR